MYQAMRLVMMMIGCILKGGISTMQPSERLAPLGIIGVQLRAPLSKLMHEEKDFCVLVSLTKNDCVYFNKELKFKSLCV